LVYKTVFILFFQGDQLRSKVKKICDGFKATSYPCPENAKERKEMSDAISIRIQELKNVLDQSLGLRYNLLQNAAASLRLWFGRVRKMKAIYHTMNLFNIEINQKCLIAECWAPVKSSSAIRGALDRGTVRIMLIYQHRN
jgi:V-type H+-transporting ATPase subunit a